MKIWKRNAVVATVLLFVCVGIYLNWSYNRNENVPTLTDTLDSSKVLGEATLVINDDVSPDLLDAASADYSDSQSTVSQSASDYFSAVRLTRQESRDSALGLLQEAASYTAGTEDESVTSASADLEKMVQTALSEAQIESLIIAKGYSDCVAFMSDDGISIAVAAPEEGLQQTDIAKISDIVTSESDYSLANLKVIEVK